MKTGYFKTVMGLLCMLALTISCEKEIKYENETVLDEIVLGHSNEGGYLEVEIPMNSISNEWFVNSPSADTWLTHEIKPGTKTLWVVVDANTTGEIRTSHINIRCKGEMQKIIVNQDSDAGVTLSRTGANFRYVGGTRTIKIMNMSEVTDIEFTIDETWCSGVLQDNSIVLTATPNEATAPLEAILTITGKRAISGKPVTNYVDLTQDEFGKEISYQCSVDGGETWIDDVPEEFTVLMVRNVDGKVISADDLDTFKGAIDSQEAPAGLDLSRAQYVNTKFPVLFSGTSARPNMTLEFIKFPSNVKEIESTAFQHCKALKSVDLTGITTIGASAFRYCGLEKLNVPNTVNSYTDYIFADNENLTEVYWNATKPDDSSKTNYYTFYIDNVEQTAKLTFTIGPDATTFPRTFLRHNNNLTSIIVEGPFTARNYFLVQCEYLESIKFLSTNPAQIAAMTCGIMWDSGHVRPGAKSTTKVIIVPRGFRDTYTAAGIISSLMDAGYDLEEALPDEDELPGPGTGENPGTPGDDEPVVTPPVSSTLPGTSWSDIK